MPAILHAVTIGFSPERYAYVTGLYLIIADHAVKVPRNSVNALMSDARSSGAIYTPFTIIEMQGRDLYH